MENKHFYIVTLGGGAGVFYIHCTDEKAVAQEIKNNADGYFTMTIWEMADEETPIRLCNPNEFTPDEPDERPQAISSEIKSSASPVFTAHDMTLPNGEKHDVTWHLYGGDAIAEIDLGGGKHANVTIDEKSPWYIPAMCAAQEAERIAEAEAAEEKRMEQEKRRAERANDPAKQAHGPVPEKEWIGTKIQGLGYRVEFSRTYDRTMIIFDSVPTDAARAIVKECGFYWSPSMGAWVKGLNWRAYRAANQAVEKLTALKEAPCKPRKRRAA